MSPEPTKRFVIEPSLECNIKCKFCYHLHRFDEWRNTRKSLDEMKTIIDQGKERGNNYMDITGGEPSIYPYITDLIQYGLSKGIKACIITNGIIGKEKAQQLLDAGIDDFLVSRHGLSETHNHITNSNHAYDIQLKFLDYIKQFMQFRFNCVINQFNQFELVSMIKELIPYKPKIVNFINFNPHHEWKNKELKASEVVADLVKVEPYLNEAIDLLEDEGIGVNVRYYPMCRIMEQHRKYICNDLHVMFDPYEWDYSTTPKTYDKYKAWGVATSNANEEKSNPCCLCDLQDICGGINKHFHRISNRLHGEQCLIQRIDPIIHRKDFMYYRRDI